MPSDNEGQEIRAGASGLSGGVPAYLVELLGDAPEDGLKHREGFYQLWGQVRDVVQPRDIIDEFWARDIASAAWDSIRLRRVKANYLLATEYFGLPAALDGLAPDPKALTDRFRRGEDEATKVVNHWLTTAYVTPVHTESFDMVAVFKEIEAFDRLIMRADATRNAAWREVERRRDTIARRLRELVQREIHDAEFTQVAAPLMASLS